MSADSDGTSVSQTAPVLETEGLTKRFGGLTAVDDVDYRVQPQRIQCIIGPNGAGKSTFLKLLTGRLFADEGEIRYEGEDITRKEPYERVRKGMSIKFQDVNVYPELTVRDNLRIAVQRQTDDYETAIDELLAMTQLQKKEQTRVDDLAHGQQQWLEIAMATAVSPNLLILDEPTAGMTVGETEETGELIESLVDDGMTIIVVEHDINFVRQIADEVTVLHNGSVFAQGSVEEIESNEAVQRIYLGEE
jgi:branched-chain amino acid transport system ATP-binding protein